MILAMLENPMLCRLTGRVSVSDDGLYGNYSILCIRFASLVSISCVSVYRTVCSEISARNFEVKFCSNILRTSEIDGFTVNRGILKLSMVFEACLRRSLGQLILVLRNLRFLWETGTFLCVTAMGLSKGLSDMDGRFSSFNSISAPFAFFMCRIVFGHDVYHP